MRFLILISAVFFHMNFDLETQFHYRGFEIMLVRICHVLMLKLSTIFNNGGLKLLPKFDFLYSVLGRF